MNEPSPVRCAVVHPGCPVVVEYVHDRNARIEAQAAFCRHLREDHGDDDLAGGLEALLIRQGSTR